jgi:hypothetical protein
VKEIKRVKGFEEGDSKCIKCGKMFHLFWNGGELDRHFCCGLEYRTEHQEIDLVIYEREEK